MTDYFENLNAAGFVAERFSQDRGKRTAGGHGRPVRIDVRGRFTMTGHSGRVAGPSGETRDVISDLTRRPSAGQVPTVCLPAFSGRGGAQ